MIISKEYLPDGRIQYNVWDGEKWHRLIDG